MKTCINCGRVTDDDANYCDFCGGRQFTELKDQVTNKGPVREEKMKLVAGIAQNLRRERLAFKIAGTITLVLSIVFAAILTFTLIGIVAGVIQSPDDGSAGAVGLAVVLTAYFGTLILTILPIAIVNLIAAGRIDYYLNTIDNDIRPTRNRISSVGIIVFDAIFNNIAMIFCIINFVTAKRHAADLDAIEMNK